MCEDEILPPPRLLSFPAGVQDMVGNLSHMYVDLCTYFNRKKNAPYLYDLMITHALDWPSLTCQWFPDKESCATSLSLTIPISPIFPPRSFDWHAIRLPARQTSPTRRIAYCSARTRPVKQQTTYKSRQCRSPRVPDQAQTYSIVAHTTTSVAS